MADHRKNLKHTILRNPKLRNAVSIFLFLTLLYSPNSTQASWKFIAVGDSQGSDNGINTTILSELATEIVDHGVDCVLFCGDLVWCRRFDELESELNIWCSIMEPVYDANIPIYTCRGNHESDGNAAVWQSIFSDLPDNGPPGEEHMTYSVIHKNALFVALDEYVNPHRVNQNWLDSELMKNSEPLVFVFGHEPAFHMHHEDCLDDYPAERDRFWNSIKNAGGRTYFTGHDHFFDHAHVDDGDGDPNNDVHQFTSGTAGAPFYTFSPPYDGDNSYYTVEQVYHAKAYGYVLAEVNDLDVSLTWMQRDTDDLQITGEYEPNEVWSFSAKPLILLSPNGGEDIPAGSVFSITWRTYESTTIENILLEYSTENGQNWNYINVVANTGSYDWIVPLVDSDQCLVRVTDFNNPTVSDTSYKAFLILCPCDFEPDGDVDFDDFAVLASSWKTTTGQPLHSPDCDISEPNDGIIDELDLAVFTNYWLLSKN
jgi:predicted phosphodiesterase